LQRAAVEDRGGGLGIPAGGESEDGTKVVEDGLEASGGQPAAGLLIDHLPGGKVPGQVSPGRAGADDAPKAVEDIAEVVDSLAGVLGEEAKIGGDEFPFGVADIAGVVLMSDHILYFHRFYNTYAYRAGRSNELRRE
jgi:hypothetical protein